MDLFSCAFAGHEPLRFPFGYDEEDELCMQIKKVMLYQICALYENGVKDFYSDCEPGASMWGAEIVLELMKKHPAIKLYCVLPYEEQVKKWTPQMREQYFTILEKSTSNHPISTHYEKNCYLQCNQYIVNHTSFIIAVYDNAPIMKLESVSHLITYAQRKKRGIIMIHPDNAKVTPITIKIEQ